MRQVEQQPCYILHERPYRETSLLIEALTRDHGRVGLVARGIRRDKPRVARGTLAPLQPLLVSFAGRGELVTLVAAESVAAGPPLAGETLVSALYLNELLVRLLPRNDPHPEIFDRYSTCLSELSSGGSVAWTLRRFERDLLVELGYALLLDVDGLHGHPIDPAAEYSYDPERGAIAWAQRPLAPGIRGSTLLAFLRDDEVPEARDLGALRRLMRTVLRHHLGGRELNAWRLFVPLPERAAR